MAMLVNMTGAEDDQVQNGHGHAGEHARPIPPETQDIAVPDYVYAMQVVLQ